MCGRYFMHAEADELTALVGQLDVEVELAPRYNIAPSQPVPLIRVNPAGRKHLGLARWGLIPSWSKGPDNRYRMINARAETIAEKPSYRNPFRYRRCVLPANGFYEWAVRDTGAKQPYAITRADKRPILLAGVWEHWGDADGNELESCSIIVRAANSQMAPVHERMPVMIEPGRLDAWLDPRQQNPEELKVFLEPPAAGLLELWPISTAVNNVRNDGAGLLESL